MNKLIKVVRISFAELSTKIHKSRLSLHNFHPSAPESIYLSPTAMVIGDASIFPKSVIFHNTVIKGDLNAVNVGYSTIIMENCSLSTVHKHPDSFEVMNTIVGDSVIIMPNSTLISCHVGDFCFIGSGSVICEGAEIEQYAYVGPNSVVPPNRIIPSGQVWAGNPARFVRHVTKGDKANHLEMRFNLDKLAESHIQETLADNTAHLAKIAKEMEMNLTQ